MRGVGGGACGNDGDDDAGGNDRDAYGNDGDGVRGSGDNYDADGVRVVGDDGVSARDCGPFQSHYGSH